MLDLDYITCQCKKPDSIPIKSGCGKYISGLFYCKKCTTWIDEKGTYLLPSGRRCICCHSRIRENPRKKTYKEKFRSER